MAEDGVEVVPPPDEPAAATRAPSKVAIQMNKLKEANNKYKSLLMLAKDRISTQQEEMDALKGTIVFIY